VRIAHLSPLPPTRSGIADYSAELLPYLAARTDVEAFSERSGAATSPITSRRGSAAVPVFDRADFAARDTLAPFDAIVCQMGNHPVHEFVYRMLLERPGVTVLHEPWLQHFVLARTAGHGDRLAYVREMTGEYGVRGTVAAAITLASGQNRLSQNCPLIGRVVDASLGVIVHSEFARRIVLQERPAARVAVVRHHVIPEVVPATDVARVRRRLGVPDGSPLFASYGFAIAEKRLDLALRAFRTVLMRHPDAVFAIAGEVPKRLGLDRLADRLGIARSVRIVGYVPPSELQAYVAAADVGVCLRHPTLGETSGILLRLLNAGRPTIVFDTGAFAAFPDDCVRKIALDGREEGRLGEAMLELVDDAEPRRALGERARTYVRQNHCIESSADAYLAFINSLTG
jgi:glycosyltransferase involved in cell wall biosynthesis